MINAVFCINKVIFVVFFNLKLINVGNRKQALALDNLTYKVPDVEGLDQACDL